MTKKVMIIGGNGFIGTNLGVCLANRGYEVYSFDINKPEILNEEITYITGDFFDDATLKENVSKMDVIVHALSTINPGNSGKLYFRGYAGDFIQTIKLGEMAENAGQKLIFLSSGGTVYGEQRIQPIQESAMSVPINHYGNVKVCIENTLRVMARQDNLNCIIARISNPYGPGQDFRKGVGFIDAAIKKFMHGEPLEIWGKGDIVRDYIYIRDVCAMLAALIDYRGEEKIFNISSGEGTSQKQIIEMQGGMGLKGKIVFKKEREIDLKEVVLDNTKIMGIYKNEITGINSGLRQYYEWIIKQS